MARIIEALKTARTYLNDDLGAKWTDPVLMPKVREAHRELQAILFVNGLPVVREISAQFTVLTGATDLGVNQPTDLVEPIRMKEKAPTESNAHLIPMSESLDLPAIEQTARLVYWSWREEKILFLGATSDRVVELTYIKGLTLPKKVTDEIGFLYGELYLGARTAAIALDSVDKGAMADKCTVLAQQNIDRIVRANVRGQQGMPVRRRPYHWRYRAIGRILR